MGIEALRQNNLENIARSARRRYLIQEDPLPGVACCGEAMEYAARRLYQQLGYKLFRRYVSAAFFKVKNSKRGHFLLIIGGKKPNFEDTFNTGVKLDPTILQFRDLFPKLGNLNGKSVFNGDYPQIYQKDSLIEDPYGYLDCIADQIRGEALIHR